MFLYFQPPEHPQRNAKRGMVDTTDPWGIPLQNSAPTDPWGAPLAAGAVPRPLHSPQQQQQDAWVAPAPPVQNPDPWIVPSTTSASSAGSQAGKGRLELRRT